MLRINYVTATMVYVSIKNNVDHLMTWEGDPKILFSDKRLQNNLCSVMLFISKQLHRNSHKGKKMQS